MKKRFIIFLLIFSITFTTVFYNSSYITANNQTSLNLVIIDFSNNKYLQNLHSTFVNKKFYNIFYINVNNNSFSNIEETITSFSPYGVIINLKDGYEYEYESLIQFIKNKHIPLVVVGQHFSFLSNKTYPLYKDSSQIYIPIVPFYNMIFKNIPKIKLSNKNIINISDLSTTNYIPIAYLDDTIKKTIVWSDYDNYIYYSQITFEMVDNPATYLKFLIELLNIQHLPAHYEVINNKVYVTPMFWNINGIGINQFFNNNRWIFNGKGHLNNIPFYKKKKYMRTIVYAESEQQNYIGIYYFHNYDINEEYQDTITENIITYANGSKENYLSFNPLFIIIINTDNDLTDISIEKLRKFSFVNADFVIMNDRIGNNDELITISNGNFIIHNNINGIDLENEDFDSGNPNTLYAVVKYAIDLYGAYRPVYLFFYGHGNGITGMFSDITSKDMLGIQELSSFLKQSTNYMNKPFEGIIFDTCLNGGSFEIVYELKDYARYIAGYGNLTHLWWNLSPDAFDFKEILPQKNLIHYSKYVMSETEPYSSFVIWNTALLDNRIVASLNSNFTNFLVDNVNREFILSSDNIYFDDIFSYTQQGVTTFFNAITYIGYFSSGVFVDISNSKHNLRISSNSVIDDITQWKFGKNNFEIKKLQIEKGEEVQYSYIIDVYRNDELIPYLENEETGYINVLMNKTSKYFIFGQPISEDKRSYYGKGWHIKYISDSYTPSTTINILFIPKVPPVKLQKVWVNINEKYYSMDYDKENNIYYLHLNVALPKSENKFVIKNNKGKLIKEIVILKHLFFMKGYDGSHTFYFQKDGKYLTDAKYLYIKYDNDRFNIRSNGLLIDDNILPLETGTNMITVKDSLEKKTVKFYIYTNSTNNLDISINNISSCSELLELNNKIDKSKYFVLYNFEKVCNIYNGYVNIDVFDKKTETIQWHTRLYIRNEYYFGYYYVK